MFCPKCFRETDDKALFCKHCGAKLVHEKTTSDNLSNLLLLIWAIVFLVLSGIETLIINCVDHWILINSWRAFYFIVCTLQCISNFLPAIAIKNKTMKIGAIILVAIPTIYFIYRNISAIFNDTF